MWIRGGRGRPLVPPETASSKSRAVAGSTVKVGNSTRSRRWGERCSASSAARRASRSSDGRNPGADLARGRASTASRAVFGSLGHGGAPVHPVLLAAPPPAAGRAPAGRVREPRRGVAGRSRARTSGWMPPLPREVRSPSGVKYSPIVSFSAPPLDRSTSCWRDALAEGAGPDDGSPRVVGEGGREDLRRGGGVAVDEDDDRAAREVCLPAVLVFGAALGARVGGDHDSAFGRKTLARQHRLVQQARRSRADRGHPPSAFPLDLFDGLPRAGQPRWSPG